MSEVRNDGIENLLGALLIARHFKIPEVSPVYMITAQKSECIQLS